MIFLSGIDRFVKRNDLIDIASLAAPGWENFIGARPVHGTLKIPMRNPMRCSLFLFTNHAQDSASPVAQEIASTDSTTFLSGFSGRLGCAVRILPTAPFQLNDLLLNQRVRSIADVKGGLLLVVGSPGVGKSTTAAAFIDHRNKTCSGTIVTAENPIEVPFRSQASVVTQREIGINVASVKLALRDAERNFAHSVLVGEIQTLEDQADTFNAARHGMFVVATGFANSAAGAVKALVADLDATGADGADLVSGTLLAVIFQVRLPSTVIGKWEFAFESLVIHEVPAVIELIRKREWNTLQACISADKDLSLNGSMADLVARGLVLREAATAQAYNKTEAVVLFDRAHSQANAAST